MKRVLEIAGWLAAVLLLAFASHSVFARAPRPQDAGAAPRAGRHDRARRAEERDDLSPADIARSARTIYVSPSRHLDKKYLEYKLQKQRELQDWGLMVVTRESAADLVLTIDRAALNYIFTLTDPRTSVVVASGKTVAINGLVAADNLGREIVKKLRDVRAAPTRRAPRKRDDRDDGEWSQS